MTTFTKKRKLHILFTDPDDITKRRMIYLEDWLKKIQKMNLMGNPLMFDGCVIDVNDKENFDYMVEKE